ncbi:hypothetical protein ONZ45_g7570 [Pleurotus djamor]|nr:hypothetical protein ONZ45_g7570 [Pleurotus djamor]
MGRLRIVNARAYCAPDSRFNLEEDEAESCDPVVPLEAFSRSSPIYVSHTNRFKMLNASTSFPLRVGLEVHEDRPVQGKAN